MDQGTVAYWRNVYHFTDADEIVHDGHVVTLTEATHPLDSSVPDDSNDGAMVWCTQCETEFLAFAEELEEN